MFHRKTLTKITKIALGAALGLNLMTGVASSAPASTPSTSSTASTTTSDPSHEKYQCPDEEYLNNVDGHGANNDDGYQSTCDEADFGGNGQESGPGNQTGKPCAGCVGNADDKNPPGQFPDGSDANSGYECDGRDRPSKNQQGNGNHGIGDENPAHTGCDSDPATPVTCPDGSTLPAGSTCPKAELCPGSDVPMTDVNNDGVANEADCNKKVDEEPKPQLCPGSDVPMTDVNNDGVANVADCSKKVDEETKPEAEVKATDVSPVAITPVVEVPETPAAPAVPAVAALVAPDNQPAQVLAATPATKARPTQVLGVQVERANLARTGLTTDLLVLLAGALLFVGALLVRTGRPRATR